MTFEKDCFYKCHSSAYEGIVFKCEEVVPEIQMVDDLGHRIAVSNPANFNKSGVNPKNWNSNNEAVRQRKNIELVHIPRETFDRLVYLGFLNAESRSGNVGKSNYAKHFIQPWSVWLDYPELTSWDHDIIKRILRTKDESGLTPEEARKLDYQKIIHICEERIRQLDHGTKRGKDNH